MLQPGRQYFRRASQAVARQAFTPIALAKWPSSARALSALSIFTDRGLGDVWARRKGDGVFFQQWVAAVRALVDCQTCAGNWQGVLNRKYPL